MNNDRTQRLREGAIAKLLLTFSVPAIVGLLAQAIYNVVDRIFVGRALGALGIAGIAVSFPYMLIFLAFSMLIGFGATALISIRLGENKKAEAELVLGNAVVLLLGASLVLTLLGWFFLEPLLVLFGASESIMPYARDYTQIIVLGTVFEIVGFGLNASIRGEGNPRLAMLTMLLGELMNVILAPIFIFVFGWGMRGAALATVLSQAAATVWIVSYFLSGRSFLKIRWHNMRLTRPICTAIVVVGSPPFFLQLAASVMQSTMNNQLDKYGGDIAISAMGIIFAVAMMFFMPIFGINQGVQPIIGYNYGARQFDRVRSALKTAVVAATGIALFGFSIMMFAPAQVIRLFNREDAALLALGVHALRICTLTMPLVGFNVVAASYFQAIGKPRQAMLISLSRQVLFLIPLILILPHFFGLNGAWAAIPSSDLLAAILAAVLITVELRRLRKAEAIIARD
ncbi:MAG: MATE family efflux transporter [Thermoguttaceae bacterium]